MAGSLLPIPHPMVPGAALIEITMDQAEQLADAAYEVAVEYDLAKYFGGKKSALAGLLIAAGTIYIPKVVFLGMIVKAQRQHQQPPPQQTASDFVHPAPPPEANGGRGHYNL